MESATPFIRKISETVRYKEMQTETPIVLGVVPEYSYTMSQFVGDGRFVLDIDVAERRNIVVLGRDVVRALFKGYDHRSEKM